MTSSDSNGLVSPLKNLEGSELTIFRYKSLLFIIVLVTLFLSISLSIYLYIPNYSRVLSFSLGLGVVCIPVYILIYCRKFKIASWWFIISGYISICIGLYQRLLEGADVHPEVNLVVLTLIALILFKPSYSLMMSIVLGITYLIFRMLIMKNLGGPFEVGQIINGIFLYGCLITFGHSTKLLLIDIEKKLTLKAKELNELNTLKDHLFAIIGHDLRHPIASLKTQLQHLSSSQSINAFPEEHIQRLMGMVDNVYITLDDLLHWSIIQQKGLKMYPQQLNLAEVVDSVVQLYKAESQYKKLTIELHQEIAPVFADENQIEIIIRNILNNAIKFSPIGGTVKITTGVIANRAQVIIQDTGCGIPAEITEALNTNPLSLGLNTGVRKSKGTGIGLIICLKLLQLNNGQLHFESAPGQGTKVFIVL